MSLVIDNVYFSYKNLPVLHGISFCAQPGDVISVLGPNGVGKSTLFKCILGLLTPQQGKVIIHETSITDMTTEAIAKEIAYIPQYHNPVFNYSVFDMVLMGTTAQTSMFETPKEAQRKQAEEALQILNISHLRDRNYLNISGGERQLTLIARAIAQQAKILIMDEPSASLDYGNKIRLMKTIQSLADNGYTIIQSTHDPEQAYKYSTKILAMLNGQTLAFGAPADIMDNKLIATLYDLEEEELFIKTAPVSLY